jgi:hypothetical protein
MSEVAVLFAHGFCWLYSAIGMAKFLGMTKIWRFGPAAVRQTTLQFLNS